MTINILENDKYSIPLKGQVSIISTDNENDFIELINPVEFKYHHERNAIAYVDVFTDNEKLINEYMNIKHFSIGSSTILQNNKDFDCILDLFHELTILNLNTILTNRASFKYLSRGYKSLVVQMLHCSNYNCIIFNQPNAFLSHDIQEELIDLYHLINPNLQVIIYTQAPAVIMKGYFDCVYNLEDFKK